MDSLNKFAPPRAGGGASGTQAVARAVDLLRAIASSSMGESSLAELARTLGFERPGQSLQVKLAQLLIQ